MGLSVLLTQGLRDRCTKMVSLHGVHELNKELFIFDDRVFHLLQYPLGRIGTGVPSSHSVVLPSIVSCHSVALSP